MANTAYAGIDIGATSIKFGLVSSDGKILHKEQRPTLADKGAEPLLHLVTNISEKLLFQAAEEEYDVPWLGVGTPGTVDFETGQVVGLSPNIVGWSGTAIGESLRNRLNLPVWVDNDVNAAALAEHRFGAGIGYDSIVCVNIGTGVGGGIVLDGHLWRGSSHAAGEIGHICINPDGPSCRCGQKGCLEAYCSSAAIMARCKRMLPNGLTAAFEDILDGDLGSLTIKKLFAAAARKDEVAQEVIRQTAHFLAVGLSGVVNLLNPDIVIIGGGIADGGGGFVEEVAAAIRRRAGASAIANLKIVKAALGNSAGFIGASLLGDER